MQAWSTLIETGEWTGASRRGVWQLSPHSWCTHVQVHGPALTFSWSNVGSAASACACVCTSLMPRPCWVRGDEEALAGRVPPWNQQDGQQSSTCTHLCSTK